MKDLKNLASVAERLDMNRNPKIVEYANKFCNSSNYFAGNSLGLVPEGVDERLQLHHDIWKEEKHDSHFYIDGKNVKFAWWEKHKQLLKTASKLLGCKNSKRCPEVAIGNGGLSVVNRLVIEDICKYIRDTTYEAGPLPVFMTIKSNFPSDDVGLKYALATVFGKHFQLIEFEPINKKTGLYDFDKLIQVIKESTNLKMGFFPGLCFSSGQKFPIERITEALHSVKAVAGFDLAHSVGNYPLHLHNWKVDFATFCNYKYNNSGPGAIAGFYVHEKWFSKPEFNPVSGWFGILAKDRFKFNPDNFRPAPGAERMILSNYPIFSMLPIEVSFETIDECGIHNMFNYHKKLSDFTYECLSRIPGIQIITPRNEHGCQISFTTKNIKQLFDHIQKENFCERRGRYIIRVAPVAYNSFQDVYNLALHISRFFAPSN